MNRYKSYSYEQSMFIPVNFNKLIIHGSFEYALSYIVDNELELSVFEFRYKNDETGAPAYDPAILLKIVLYAYSRGITSSRQIERLCRENVIFIVVSADTKPHFITIAEFISSMQEQTIPLFRDILLYCQESDLIDKTMFAIDGCKISSNASKEWSDTRQDYEKKIEKLEKTIRYQYKGSKAVAYMCQREDFRQCPLKKQCVRNINAEGHQVHIFYKRKNERLLQRMRNKIDSAYGKYIYSKRMQIIEPIFANIKNKRLKRFSLRGKIKVDIQWKLFAIVHNIGKIFRYGPVFA